MEKKYRQNRKFVHRNMVLVVYFVLRILVLLTMISQIMKKNYENVYICLLTLILFMIPSIVERRMQIELPDTLEIVILVFIFAAEILGEIEAYYLTIPYWDMILHTVNGFLFAAIGFCVVSILNKDKKIAMHLSPSYLAIMAFCFSMTIGVLWEFFEWGMDACFGLDMQKNTVVKNLVTVELNPSGGNVAYTVKGIQDTVLICGDGSQRKMRIGGYLDIGLHDTMLDLLVNFVGAVLFSFLGYFYVKSRGKGRIAGSFIPKVIGNASNEEKTTGE